jgi:hypothetical protein
MDDGFGSASDAPTAGFNSDTYDLVLRSGLFDLAWYCGA